LSLRFFVIRGLSDPATADDKPFLDSFVQADNTHVFQTLATRNAASLLKAFLDSGMLSEPYDLVSHFVTLQTNAKRAKEELEQLKVFLEEKFEMKKKKWVYSVDPLRETGISCSQTARLDYNTIWRTAVMRVLVQANQKDLMTKIVEEEMRLKKLDDNTSCEWEVKPLTTLQKRELTFIENEKRPKTQRQRAPETWDQWVEIITKANRNPKGTQKRKSQARKTGNPKRTKRPSKTDHAGASLLDSLQRSPLDYALIHSSPLGTSLESPSVPILQGQAEPVLVQAEPILVSPIGAGR